MVRTLGLVLVLAQASTDPPAIVQLYHERLKPGADAEYSRIEEAAAEVCARWKCPNYYLALESLEGPKEVWWLNAFASEADRDRVGRAYDQDTEMMTALRDVLQPKKELVREPQNFVATYRPDLSVGCAWRMDGARFFVFEPGGASGAPPGSPRGSAGCVFEAPDARFVLAPAATRTEADRRAAVGGLHARILAIRPAWSLPAPAWIAADPDFWRTSPAARTKGGER
jgi:hypothetical protein